MEDVFAWFFRDTADPTVAAILWLLVIAVGVVFAVGAIVFPHAKGVRSDVITLGGGVLVVLTAYFTARRLADGDAQRRTEQLAKALELLQSDKPEVRAGVAGLLNAMLDERNTEITPRRRRNELVAQHHELAIREALRLAHLPVSAEPRRLSGAGQPAASPSKPTDS